MWKLPGKLRIIAENKLFSPGWDLTTDFLLMRQNFDAFFILLTIIQSLPNPLIGDPNPESNEYIFILMQNFSNK
jgi:hypothetical protein